MKPFYALPILMLIGIGLFCLASGRLASPVVSKVDKDEPAYDSLASEEVSDKDSVAKLSPQDYQQQRFRRWRRRRDPNDRGGVPIWKNEQADPDDVFTFVRIRYESYRGRYRWNTDYPDADLNISYRLQQLTSIKTDPNGKILRLTDPELFKYPFIYIIEPGGMTLSDAEAAALREYL